MDKMKYKLEDMSWMEAEEALKAGIALLPIGTIHGHGPTPISIDYTSVQRFADEVGRRTGMITLPVLPYGENDKQKFYPGSITIEPDTLQYLYEDIFQSLNRFGVKKVLVLNGHGGNREALIRAAKTVRELDMIIAIQEWWRILGKLLPEFHERGCHIEELAVALAIQGKDIADLQEGGYTGEWGDPPDIPIPTWNVFGENITPLGFNDFEYKGGRVIIPIQTWDIDIPGGTEVNSEDLDEIYENGKEIIKRVIDYLVDFAEEFKRIDVKGALKSKD
jgi:creatinine amidohydrolase/Fe(II)-dependent formamide hydrolase-like protein